MWLGERVGTHQPEVLTHLRVAHSFYSAPSFTRLAPQPPHHTAPSYCASHSPSTQVVAGDLDQPSSLEPHLARARAIYCHALSGDAASADPAELARGQALAQLAGRYADQLQLVVYNSSAGRGSNAGISQVRARHRSMSCWCRPGAAAASPGGSCH